MHWSVQRCCLVENVHLPCPPLSGPLPWATLWVTYSVHCTVKFVLCSWPILIWGAVARHHAAPGHQIKVFDTGGWGGDRQTWEKPMQIQVERANSPWKGPASWIQPKTFSLKSVQVRMSDHSSEEPWVVSEELERWKWVVFSLRWIPCRSILSSNLACCKPRPPWCTRKNLDRCRLRAFVSANFFQLACSLMKAAKN